MKQNTESEKRMELAHIATLGLSLVGLYEVAPWLLDEGRWSK